MKTQSRPGVNAIAARGWLSAHKWLLLRRLSQLTILGLFLVGPWLGLWIVKGNLNSSLTLGLLPLTDPYVLLQSMFTGNPPETIAITGALIVLVFYFLVGGRAYCSWVCPVNIITDATLIDTADVYGFGHSEDLIAKVLKERGKRNVIIASKAGNDFYFCDHRMSCKLQIA